MALEFTDQNFQSEVIASDKPVLVDFSATWCQPCKQLSPTIDALAEEYEGKVKIGKVDIDQSQDTAAKLGIMSVPTCVIFKGGEKVDTVVGVHAKDVFKEKLDALL